MSVVCSPCSVLSRSMSMAIGSRFCGVYLGDSFLGRKSILALGLASPVKYLLIACPFLQLLSDFAAAVYQVAAVVGGSAKSNTFCRSVLGNLA